MAALPKFDACSLSFSKAIGDVVASATTSGNKLTDDERKALGLFVASLLGA